MSHVLQARYGCKKVTDSGLGAIAAGCPSLQYLSLRRCYDVTDDGLAVVAAGCPNIEHLNLSGCMNVTDVGAALFSNAEVSR